MKEFEVEITETLQRTVVIRAGSRAEAEVLAEELWNNEEFVLGAEDFVGAEFSAVSEKEIAPKYRKRKDEMESRVPIKQYLQKFPKWGRFGVTSVTPFLLLPVHPEGCTPARRT